MTKTDGESTYELYVSYDPDRDDLASSLEFLSKAIRNQAKADIIMAQGFETNLTTKIVLDDIQKSSIRLFVKNVLQNTKEEQIREKGALAYWNQFLIEARKPFLDYSSTHEGLEKREDLHEIKEQVVQIAQQNNVNMVVIEGLADEKIAECLANYSVPSGLGSQQEYKAICNGEEFNVNKSFKVTPDQIANTLSGGEKTFDNQIVYLKPKTAVYQGEGMWDFHEAKSGKIIKGKILHEEWLQRFQDGAMTADEYPFPGVVLKAKADIEIKFDEANFRKGETYFIKEIYGPVPPEDVEQINIDGI